MALSSKLNDLCRSVSLSVHLDKRKEKDRLFVGEGRFVVFYDLGLEGAGGYEAVVQPRSDRSDRRRYSAPVLANRRDRYLHGAGRWAMELPMEGH